MARPSTAASRATRSARCRGGLRDVPEAGRRRPCGRVAAPAVDGPPPWRRSSRGRSSCAAPTAVWPRRCGQRAGARSAAARPERAESGSGARPCRAADRFASSAPAPGAAVAVCGSRLRRGSILSGSRRSSSSFSPRSSRFDRTATRALGHELVVCRPEGVPDEVEAELRVLSSRGERAPGRRPPATAFA